MFEFEDYAEKILFQIQRASSRTLPQNSWSSAIMNRSVSTLLFENYIYLKQLKSVSLAALALKVRKGSCKVQVPEFA